MCNSYSKRHIRQQSFRFFTLYFSFVFVIRLVAGTVGFANSLSDSEQLYLKQKQEIVFISQSNYPPFEFIDSHGDRKGMSIELAQWMATEFGFKARFIDASFKQAQEAVRSGQADVLTSFFYSKTRDRSFDFTHTMFEVPAMIFVRSDRPDIISLHDLKHKRIAMQQSDYAKEFLKANNIQCSIIATKNFAEAADRVIAGVADAVIGDKQIILYHLYSKGLTAKLKSVGKPLYIGQNCMSVLEGNKDLIAILNKGLDLAKERRVLLKINQKWFGTQYTGKNHWLQTNSNYFLAAGIIILFVLSLIIIWNLRLGRLVYQKTKELRESEGRFRTLSSASWEAIIIHHEGHIIQANEQFYDMFGYSPEELADKQAIPIIFTPESVIDVFKHINEDNTDPYEAIARDKDGSIIYLEIRVRLLNYHGKKVRMVAMRDISAHKQAEKDREKLISELEFKNSELESFTYTVSHDLKSPIITIKGFLGLLKKDIHSQDYKQIDNTINRIASAANKMHQLLSELLELSRIGRVINPPETISLDNLTDKAVELVYQQINDQQVQVIIQDKLPMIYGDYQRLLEVMINLLANAVKYMDSQAKPAITIGAEEKANETVIFVQDNGKGIEIKQQQKVFDLFKQLDPRCDGSGIGLALVKRIIEVHGGRVWVESDGPKTGSKFYFSLPKKGPIYGKQS